MQVARKGLSEGLIFGGRSEGCKGAGHGKMCGQGVLLSGSRKCKGPEAGSRL